VTAYLLNPQYALKGSSIDAPCPTVIARQDKMPLQLVTPSYVGQPDQYVPEHLHDTPTDSLAMRQIKEYCRLNGIYDIFLRMLLVDELKRIQGFPVDYQLVGNQATKKKHIGNSVEVTMATFLCKSLVNGITAPSTPKIYQPELQLF
jgi:DNA (cytosine-5)-methyltransferase 1